MTANGARLRLLSDENATKGFRTAVSLHSHTRHSKESMAFVPHYVSRVPILAHYFRKWTDRYRQLHGKEIDFTNGYWTPPCSPHIVYQSEAKQIEQTIGLRAIVSVTDHDDIEASSFLRMIDDSTGVPISFEWTVPFEEGFFHVGVHNLSPKHVTEIMTETASYTRQDSKEKLATLFRMLNESPETLIVLNHPFWDIEFAGAKQHETSFRSFLTQYREWIHALEVNGYRSWRENKRVISAANEFGMVIVSGGDRHGCDANAVLNLTESETLAGFIEEVRRDKRSEIVLMPEYVEPLLARQLKGFADVVRPYPDFPQGQQKWHDRVFFDLRGEEVKPLSHYWPQKGAPKIAKRVVGCLCAVGSHPVEPFLRRVLIGKRKMAHQEITAVTRAQLQFQDAQADG
jgi:hypothetical protein